MMYTNTINSFIDLALKKVVTLKQDPSSLFIGAMMAGAYIGFGVILIFSVSQEVATEYQKLVMGLTFAIALTLVVFAGSELFTGHIMYMTLGCLDGKTTIGDLINIWIVVWVGNFVGSIGLCALFFLTGDLAYLAATESLLQKIAISKMNSSAIELLSKGALCNTLVCLALWASARVNSDTTKCIIIFWCLLAFIASGYEHSVANMTLLTLSLIGDHTESISMGGLFFNLFFVTLGNIIGGAGFVAYGYWKADGR